MGRDEESQAPQLLRQWVAERLRAEIQGGSLGPGSWLRQERLARELGVSQMPVREALKQLTAEGLVEHVPNRGARVVELSAEDVEDLYAHRALLEERAARFAAGRITGEELAELRSLNEGMLACTTPRDLAHYRELNRRFHAVAFAASRRAYLVRTLAQIWAAFPTMLWSNVPHVAVASVPGRDEPDAEEHAELLAALEARDGERAARAARRHIESAAAALLAGMRASP